MTTPKLENKIYSLDELFRLCALKKSVICPRYGNKSIPAAFAMNYTGDLLRRMFDSGLYIYKKESKND